MSPQTILVLGGAGVQNSAVVKVLCAANIWNIRVLTRSVKSSHAAEIASLPNVTLVEGECYDEETLVSAFQGADSCFVNTNGFAIGEKNEIYWGIRMYEIARWAGVKHFIYSSLPYVSKNGDFDPKRRVPFADGKGKVAQYLEAMPTKPMVWSVLSTGPYSSIWEQPPVPIDGTYVFRYPLGTGAMPLVSLEDTGEYAKWMFQHPKQSSGLQLGTAIAHVSGEDMAKAFEVVNGKKARYEDIPLDKLLAGLPEMKIGGALGDDPTLKTAVEHFGPWWGIWQDSAGNTGCWQRDYDLLDEIFPGRIRSVEEWMRKEGYNGEGKKVLKTGLY